MISAATASILVLKAAIGGASPDVPLQVPAAKASSPALRSAPHGCSGDDVACGDRVTHALDKPNITGQCPLDMPFSARFETDTSRP